MFVVTVLFQIAPPHAADFQAAIRDNAVHSLADEPGCHHFDVCLDADAPDEIFLYELYEDEAAFEAHKQTPHYTSFSDLTAPWVAAKTVRTFTLQGRGT